MPNIWGILQRKWDFKDKKWKFSFCIKIGQVFCLNSTSLLHLSIYCILFWISSYGMLKLTRWKKCWIQKGNLFSITFTHFKLMALRSLPHNLKDLRCFLSPLTNFDLSKRNADISCIEKSKIVLNSKGYLVATYICRYLLLFGFPIRNILVLFSKKIEEKAKLTQSIFGRPK